MESITETKIIKNVSLVTDTMTESNDGQICILNKLIKDGYIITDFHAYSHDKDNGGILHITMVKETRIDGKEKAGAE